MKWTLITILSRNFKFDRHLSKEICVSAYRRLTNRFCYGKRFLNVGGGGGGGGGGMGVLFKKATIHFPSGGIAREPVSMEGFYK